MRTEPKMTQCKWPIHEGWVSPDNVAIIEQSCTFLLPSTDVRHNLGERINEWAPPWSIHYKGRSQPYRQHKVQSNSTSKTLYCSCPPQAKNHFGRPEWDKSCLAVSGSGEERVGCLPVVQDPLQEGISVQRTAEGLREGRGESVHVKETRKGKTWMNPGWVLWSSWFLHICTHGCASVSAQICIYLHVS